MEEISNISDKKTLHKIYEIATEQKHSFLYVNFMAHDKNEIFKINFEKKDCFKK